MRNSFTRLPFLLLALLALPAFFAACGDDDSDDPDPTASEAPAETATQPASAYPVTVTDLLGRDVEIVATPERIVALSPTGVELVYALGGEIVGRSTTVDFPAEALAAADVGSAYQPDLEAILALEPDLIVADSVIHAQPALRGPLEELGVPIIFAGAESYQDVLDAIAVVAIALDAVAEGEALVAGLESSLAAAKTALAGVDASAVVLIADRDQVLYGAKATSYVGDLMEQLGITNPAADQPDAGPFPGYSTIPIEQLLAYNPEFILTITPAPEPAPRLSTLIPQIPPLLGTTAVTSGNVIELDLDLFLQAPGPRMAEALQALVDAVNGS